MADETDEPPDPVRAELKRYEDSGEIVPGAAEKLAGLWGRGLRSLTPDQIAETVAERLDGDYGKRHRNPEHTPAPGSELRAALARRADLLANGEETVDELVKAWGIDAAGLPKAKVEALVVRKLGSRDADPHLKTPHPTPPHEERLYGILARHFADVLDDRGRASLSRALGSAIAARGEEDVVREVARQLRFPTVAARYAIEGRAIAGDDPRTRYRAPTSGPTEPEARRSLVDPTRTARTPDKPSEEGPPKRKSLVS